MKRFPPLTPEAILARLRIDLELGRAYWIDPTKYHLPLVGNEAGCARSGGSRKRYWHVKLGGIPYRRSHLIFAVGVGAWPADQVDHINGDSLDDRLCNLRSANQTQNAWNHRTRTRRIQLPMGVRYTAQGRYQARLAVNKKMLHLGTFETVDDASAVYIEARMKHYGEFSGL